MSIVKVERAWERERDSCSGSDTERESEREIEGVRESGSKMK